MDALSLGIEMVVVEGVDIPRMFEMETKRPLPEHVQRLRAMEMRHDDIVLLAYPKSGTNKIQDTRHKKTLLSQKRN